MKNAHCHQCDDLITSESRPPRYSGRGIDDIDSSMYALDDDEIRGFKFRHPL